MLSEPNDLQSTQNERKEQLDFLNRLTALQLRLVAISGYSSFCYRSRSHQPTFRSDFRENPGLSTKEWEIWKSNVPVFKTLSEEDEGKLKDFTGTVPLYLFVIQKIMEDNLTKSTGRVPIEEIFARYDDYEGGTIRTYLLRSSYKQSCDESIFY